MFYNSDFGKKLLKEKYNEFNYKVPEKESYSIGERQEPEKEIKTKPKTLKDFLK